MTLWFLAPPAIADPIPGEADPAYLAAVETWLAGDDLPALKALAALARDDNAAAQILLAQIAENVHLHKHVTSELEREAWVELLRIPGGWFGKSWLTAAQNVPLAQALLASNDPATYVDAVRVLVAEGEHGAAAKIVDRAMFPFNVSQSETLARAIAPVLHGDNAVLAASIALTQYMFTDANTDPNWSAEKSEFAFENTMKDHPKGRLTWYPITPRDFFEDPRKRDLVLTHAANVTALRPLTEFCSAACPHAVNSCVAVGAVELFSTGPLPFKSPSERLIPNDVYWASDRITGDLLRRFRPDPNRAAQFAPYDTCFYPAIDTATTAGR